MSFYRSSISGQLAGFEREVRGIMTRVLFAGGNRFRTRMKRERLSGPPGLYVKTGRLRRSLRLVRQPTLRFNEVGVYYAIGGGMAPYAAEHEANGRLGFRRVWGEEAAKTIEELKMALQFVRGRGGRFGGAIGGLESAITTTGAATAEDLISDANWARARGGTGGETRGNAKRQMKGLIAWHDRTLEKFRTRAGTGGVRITSGHESAAKVNWTSAKQGMDYRLHKLSVLAKRTRVRITRGLRRGR